MALMPTSSRFMLSAENAMSSLWQRVQAAFGQVDFSPEQSLAETPGIDPNFIPQVPMSNANLDMNTLVQLGRMGLKRGKEITAQTHPRLYHDWAAMSARAGMAKPPQLILVESTMVNAITLSRDEVAVTTEMLKLLNLREVNAVLGHELGHGSSDHSTPRALALVLLGGAGVIAGNVFGRIGGIGRFIDHTKPNPSFIRKAAKWLFGDGVDQSSVLASEIYMGVGGAAGSIAASNLTVRPTELDADRKGAMISGDPEGLISALQKLEQSRHAGPVARVVGQIVSGYPSTETRIARLRTMTNTPHPEAAPVLAVATQPTPQVSAVTADARVAVPALAQTAAL